LKYIISLLIVLAIALGPFGSVALSAPSNSGSFYSGYPTFSIVNVVKDTLVTIKTHNLPAQDEFRLRMGKIGTRGVNGIKVGNFSTGKGSSQTLTFDIPAALHGQKMVSIRIESTTGSGYYAYNWFYNAGSTGKGGQTGYSGYPTITILGVVRNKSVTFRANNLPPNDEFKVLMNKMGARGVNGNPVGSFKTGTSGKQTFTFSIPENFYGRYQIAIRIQSTTGSGYYAYNWFYNNTTK
jgi:hypothetical protein